MTDANQNVVWQATYNPFGAVTSVTGSASLNLRAPGQWFQIESGLHYNWFRSYDPSLGRYTQPDPLGFVNGPSIYGYVNQNPTNNVDPLGLWQLTVSGGEGPAALITLGYNGGQWNLGLYTGVGEGLSVSYNPADLGCSEPGFVVVNVRASGVIGLGPNIHGEAEIGFGNALGTVGLHIPLTPFDLGVSEKN